MRRPRDPFLQQPVEQLPRDWRLSLHEPAPVFDPTPQLSLVTSDVVEAEVVGRVERGEFALQTHETLLAIAKRSRGDLNPPANGDRLEDPSFRLNALDLGTENVTSRLDGVIGRPDLRERIRDRSLNDFRVEALARLPSLPETGLAEARGRAPEGYALAE